MDGITFAECSTLDDALGALADGKGEARVVAGGTDLLLLMRRGAVRATTLVDVCAIPGLRYVRRDGDVVRIGPAARLSDVLASDELARSCPLLPRAVSQMASPLVRNAATLVGNIACATPAADSAPPLLVLDARLVLRSATGEREVPLDGYFLGNRRTALRPDELVAELVVPVPPPGYFGAFEKVGRRRALSCAVLSVAAGLSFDGGRVSAARIALGSVAPTPVRAPKAEAAIEGADLAAADIDAAEAGRIATEVAQAAAGEANPISDVRGSAGYRRAVVAALVGRIVRAAIAGRGGGR